MTNFLNPLCGLHACNVVISDHNNQGQCKCLGCVGNFCQVCQQYKDLLDEANKNNQIKLERCIACMKQKEQQR